MKQIIVNLKNKEEEEKLKSLLNHNYFENYEDFDKQAVKRKLSRKMRLLASVALGFMLLLGGFIIWQMEEIGSQQIKLKRLKSEGLWQENILKAVRDSLLTKEKELYNIKKQIKK